MRKVNLIQGTESWKAWRRDGLTATEAAVVLGQSPYKTIWRLWMEKKGRALPPDLSAVPAVSYGKKFESTARQLFEDKHGLAPAVCGEFDADPRYRASFDGLTLEGIPVEIKCPQENTLADVRLNRELSEAYMLYYVQVQHQLLVSGASYGWLVFLDNLSLLEFRIERNDDLIQKIKEAGDRFLASLENDEEPNPDPSQDPFIPSGNTAVSWQQAAQTWLECEKKIKEVEEIKKVQNKAKETLRTLMGDFQTGEAFGLKITVSESIGCIDWKEAAINGGIKPEDAEKFRKKGRKTVRIIATGRTTPELIQAEDLKRLEELNRSQPVWIW